MNLPLATNIRTLSISETHSTLPSDEHQEGLEGLEDLKDQEIPTEGQTFQEEYPLLILSLSNPQET